MKKMVTALFFSTLLLAFPVAPVIAGAGHSHGPQKAISSEQAASRASEFIVRMVDAKKIDASWVKIAPDNVEKKTFSQGPEWVITFKNINIKDPTKQTLYMFLSLSGDALGANYTGQ
jgi:hypothetical protein